MENTSYVFSFQGMFLYLVTTGLTFDIILYDNSTNQSKYESGKKCTHDECKS